MKIPLLACLLLASWLINPVFAEQNRPDYDLDGDGLIEINDLADLAAIGQSQDGKSLYGVSTGCPAGGCSGFELTRDLDFDTNGDGRMDERDAYWNGGAGWRPLDTFSSLLDGNGHHIRNLYINIKDFGYAGLFERVEGASVRRLQLDGPLMSIAGTYVGAVAAYGIDSDFSEILVQGRIRAELFAGGLIGNGFGNRINGAVVAADIYTPYNSQFIWGDRNNQLANALMTGRLVVRDSALPYLPSVVGYAKQSILYLHAKSLSEEYDPILFTAEQSFIHVSNNFDSSGQPLRVPAEQLRCGLNTQCNGGADYSGWDMTLGSDGKPYWDFGNGKQAPGLRLLGKVFRDSDGDGVFDEDDAFPLVSLASLDADQDGAPDAVAEACDTQCLQQAGLILDQLPNNPAVALDADLDGKPDAWLPGCDSRCQTASGLLLDSSLNDSDNDGIANEGDKDDFNAGKLDADSDSNGLIEVHTLEELDAIRFSPLGAGRVLQEGGAVDSSGCPLQLYQGRYQARCRGFELANNLDFDTNNDGVLDDQDRYWNQGTGWLPINYFSGEFNGNGFQISHFWSHQNDGGLFRIIRNALIQKLVLIGPMSGQMPASGSSFVTVFAKGSKFYELVVSGKYGGVAARSEGGDFNQVMCAVENGGITGGNYGNRVSSSVSTGIKRVAAGDIVSGSDIDSLTRTLVARTNAAERPLLSRTSSAPSDTVVEASYFLDWLEPSATPNNTYDLKTLSCATGPDSTECTTTPLYQGWGKDKNDLGQPLWNFGNQQQLPGFNLFGKVFRDGDGDGVLDEYDRFPTQFAASFDADNDGAADAWTPGCKERCQSDSALTLDQFPTNPAAIADGDLDGLPDSWAANCGATCRANSGLELDKFLGDSDNDGLLNTSDNDDDGDGETDADADSNGLIDINTLTQLNAVRFNPRGTGLALTRSARIDVSGCPTTLIDGRLTQQCWGYELKADLDFDTNNDGKMDAKDIYWRNGAGWLPLGDSDQPFATRFEGNHHQIRNLRINSGADSFGAALFGVAQDARIEHIEISGPLTQVAGGTAALLLGYGKRVQIEEIAVAGKVQGRTAAALVLSAQSSRINAVFSSANVTATEAASGLIGGGLDNQLSNCLVTGNVQGGQGSAGLIAGDKPSFGEYTPNQVTNCLSLVSIRSSFNDWPNPLGNTAAALNSYTSSLLTLHGREQLPMFSLAQLQCPQAANDTACASQTLYQGWDKALNSEGKNYWAFGDGKQLPGLNILGKTLRDSDGDGSPDGQDAFPLNAAAATDIDKDGAADAWNLSCNAQCRTNSGLVFDAFPSQIAAFKDEDLDGQPDAWGKAPGCDSRCEANSGLTLDTHLADLDNDGISDDKDEDDNDDGLLDADQDGNGLVEITTLEQLSAIRFDLAGHGRALVAGKTDSSGCPIVIAQGLRVRQCHGYELKQSLDFDTNQDGRINNQDTYWNNGEGWNSIKGAQYEPFTGTFDGHGFALHNYWADYHGGLFDTLSGAKVTRLVMDGPLMSVGSHFNSPVGAVANSASQSQLSEIVVTGSVSASITVGGILGKGIDTQLDAVVSVGSVQGYQMVGGIAGELDRSSGISNALTSGKLKAYAAQSFGGGFSPNNQSGGLVGKGEGYLLTSFSSRSLDIKDQTFSGTSASAQTLGASYFVTEWVANSEQEPGAFSLTQLQCPTASDNSQCTGKPLYEGWSQERDASGQPYWDFGNNTQLPGLRLFGKIYRDGDGDGVLEITRAADVNIAPRLELTLSQGNKVVSAAVIGEGDIRIDAQAKDPNSTDSLSYSWYLDEQKLSESRSTLTLNSQTLAVGTHQIKALVTDSGAPALSTSQTLSFELKPAKTTGPVVAGALDWRCLLLLVLCLGRKRQSRH